MTIDELKNMRINAITIGAVKGTSPLRISLTIIHMYLEIIRAKLRLSKSNIPCDIDGAITKKEWEFAIDIAARMDVNPQLKLTVKQMHWIVIIQEKLQIYAKENFLPPILHDPNEDIDN